MKDRKTRRLVPLALSMALLGMSGAASGAGGRTEAFCNTTPIAIPVSGTSGPASVYPSTVTGTGMPPSVTKLTVQLIGLSHTFPGDLDIMLVGPQGQQVMLMSDAGGSGDLVAADLIFDDGAPGPLPGTAIAAGAYRPTDLGTPPDPFPAPAPAGTPSTQLSSFNGSNPNGVWSLYINDDAGIDTGSLNGWCVNITSEIPGPVAVPALGGLGLGLL
ncbi:MAG: hypothetical protein AB7S98_24205 [Burkholderiaceae bacterium]